MRAKKTNANSGTPVTDAPQPVETFADEQPPAAKGGDPDFFEQLQRYTADDYQAGLKIYVYRNWPVIDKRDENHFLAKISESFDEDYLLRHFGSGKYYLRLNNRRGETLASKAVSIHNRDFPPKVAPGEVVESDPRNEAYFKAWPAAAQPPQPADAGALAELSKLATKVLDQRQATAPEGEQANLTNTLINWALTQTTKERDAADPTRITGLLKELKLLLPQQQPADGLALVDRVLSVAERLNPARPKEVEDPLVYVDRVLSLADKLRPAQSPVVATGDGGTAITAVAAIVHEVGTLLRDPLAIAAQMWAASKARNAAGAQIPARSQPQAAPAPVVALPVEPHGQAQAGAAQPSANTPPPPELIAVANQMTPVMLRWLFADAPGAQQGADFAAFVFDGWGEENLKLIQGVGTAGLVELYRGSPFWATIAGVEAKFRDFVAAFVEWEPAPEEQQPESDHEE
jgi:hypothetical protein